MTLKQIQALNDLLEDLLPQYWQPFPVCRDQLSQTLPMGLDLRLPWLGC